MADLSLSLYTWNDYADLYLSSYI